MSGYDDNDLRALDRLEDLLEAYSAARLAPAGPVLARMRANVVAQHAAAVATAAAGRLALPAPQPRSWLRWLSLDSAFARRAMALGFAATLTVGTSAAVLAAPPGSPFYSARVYLEAVLMPTQIDARLAAHQKLLDERIADAQLAAARSDAAALAAALAAYQDEVAAATADVGDDAARLAHLEDELTKHTLVLTALEAKLPDQASIDNAIAASSKAIDKLRAKGDQQAHPSHPPTGPGSGNGQGGGGGQGGGQGGGNGNGGGNGPGQNEGD